jgi:hypothetical protein
MPQARERSENEQRNGPNKHNPHTIQAAELLGWDMK